MIDKKVLCVTDMHITPRANNEVHIEQEINTKEILHYSKEMKRDVVIKRFVESIDYTVTGITTDGDTFTITFKDPKGLTIKYNEEKNNEIRN